MSATFTCITCRVAFMDMDIQRAHYKTDWHRYNLKRKVADLPRVTAENFKERVLAQQAQTVEKKNTSGHCEICNKHFASENAFVNHVNSKKHKEQQLRKEESESKTSSKKRSSSTASDASCSSMIREKNAKNKAIRDAMLDEVQQAGGSGEGVGSSTTTAATGGSGEPAGQGDVEMEDAESLDEDSVDSDWEDGDGLGEEECLFCSYISEDFETNLTHMTNTHGFFIPDTEYLIDLPGLINYLGLKVGEGHLCLWCSEKGKSFLSTSAVQKHMLDKGHCKLLHEGNALVEYVDFYDYRSSYPDYDASKSSSDKTDDMDDGDDDESVNTDQLNDEAYALVLPSGAEIGHRSLMRYFKQKLRPGQQRSITSVSKLVHQYRALGWTGTTGKAAQKKAKDMAYVHRLRSRYHMQLGCKANKLQTHFRQQILF